METEGFIEGWLLGVALFDRNSEGFGKGESFTLGALLGVCVTPINMQVPAVLSQ